jgi:AcrR family transcriptional regulator
MFNSRAQTISPPADELPETPRRLLDAAEAAVADHGLAGVSLREITARAGVNLALVKYHFRSKDGLIDAMLARRMEPIAARRLALLDALEAEHPRGALPLEAVLDALIRPVVEQGLGGGKEGRAFLRMMGRLFSEPPAHTMRVIRGHMLPTMQRFDAAFARALPRLSEHEMAWRKIAGFGAVHHTLLMLSNLDSVPLPLRLFHGKRHRHTPEDVTRRLVAFIAAGMCVQIAED